METQEKKTAEVKPSAKKSTGTGSSPKAPVKKPTVPSKTTASAQKEEKVEVKEEPSLTADEPMDLEMTVSEVEETPVETTGKSIVTMPESPVIKVMLVSSSVKEVVPEPESPEEKTTSAPVKEAPSELKKEKKPMNWVCLQAAAQCVMAATMVIAVILFFVGCTVDVPEKIPTWSYIPSISLKDGMEFQFHPETATVDVLKDEEVLKTLGEGDTYAFMPYRYLISVVYEESLVLVLNQSEELARFVLE